jgi:hypothetical protein
MDDDVAELLGAGIKETPPVPQATREQKVEAFEGARTKRNGLKNEQDMVRSMAYDIDRVQIAQRLRYLKARYQGGSAQLSHYHTIPGHWGVFQRPTPPPPPPTPHLTDEQREALLKIAKELAPVMGSINEAFRALSAAISSCADAMIAAFAPLLDLLDQSESIPRQPQCPSHAIALRGGRCPRCDRRRDPHSRR